MKLREFAGRRHTPPTELSDRVSAASPHVRAALLQRLGELADPLGIPRSEDPNVALGRLADHLAQGRDDEIWLALYVLSAQLPELATVQRVARATRLDGALTAFDQEVLTPLLETGEDELLRSVEVITDRVLVDIHNASCSDLSTGIQRVTREAGRRWRRDHDPVFINWQMPAAAFGRLTDEEATRVLIDAQAVAHEIDPFTRPVLVPWRCTYILAELNAEVPRADPLHAMLRYSGCRSGAIGFDCVPLTTAETVQDGMANGFAAGLAALSHANRIACISRGAQIEYEGWRKMLGGTGLTGPDTAAILLPAQAQAPSAPALAKARERFVLGDLPLVLSVGSHEPRKNHLALLHAAELLWRKGLRFSMAFVGGGGWHGDRFAHRIEELQAQNRPVQLERGLPDDLLWAVYSLSRCTVFPSLNEGFGLPVAESLASGTPVITSNFGSMAEIGAGGGALLVDPRDDHAIADALERLLTDDALHARLSAEAAARPERTWDQYATQTWAYLVDE